MSCTSKELKEIKEQFFGGSVRRFRHWANPRFIMTDGVHTVAEKAGCHWLMDIVATEMEPLYNKAWLDGKASVGQIRLQVHPSGIRPQMSIELSLEDDAPLALAKSIDLTDFPQGEWLFFLGTDENPQGGYLTVCMLPEEY